MDAWRDAKMVSDLASEILQLCRESHTHIAVAESLTGGLLSASFVDVAGASDVFLGSVVAYQNEIKQDILGVSRELLATRGAVDSKVACQMALGVRSRFALASRISVDGVISVSTTGVAGPKSTQFQPVGKVFIGISGSKLNEKSQAFEFDLTGNRSEIRQQAVYYALVKLREQFVS